MPSKDAVYKVEMDTEGCSHCKSGAMWTIVGPEGVALGQSWGDKETVEDICEYMNDAYEAGLETGKDAK